MQDIMLWEDTKQVAEIKEIYGKDLTETEFKMLIGIGKATGLNPFLREIWAVKYGNQPACIFIGRDGYRKAAQANQQYDYHIVDAVYSNDQFKIENGLVSHSYGGGNRGDLLGAYCIVKRKSASQPVYLYVDRSEYDIKKSVWVQKPATMIKKVAEAQALRMAFQDIFSGTYDETEAWEEKQTATVASPKTQGGVIDVTANGNPKGTITEPQNAKIYALLNDLGASKEQADEYSVRNFGVRISGLSVEQAGKFIEALEKRLLEKAASYVEQVIEEGIVADLPAHAEPTSMSVEELASKMGGAIVDDPIPEPNASSSGVEAMRRARDSYMTGSSGVSL